MFFGKLNNGATYFWYYFSFAEVTKVSNKDHDLEEVEPKGKYVLAAKVTEAKEDNLETPMEEDDPNEPGDKVNDSVNSVLTNIKSVPCSKDDEISKGETILII